MKCHRDISMHVSRAKYGLSHDLIISNNKTDVFTQVWLLSFHIVTECRCNVLHFNSACEWLVLIACLSP
jgi:hypothetical protein